MCSWCKCVTCPYRELFLTILTCIHNYLKQLFLLEVFVVLPVFSCVCTYVFFSCLGLFRITFVSHTSVVLMLKRTQIHTTPTHTHTFVCTHCQLQRQSCKEMQNKCMHMVHTHKYMYAHTHMHVIVHGSTRAILS